MTPDNSLYQENNWEKGESVCNLPTQRQEKRWWKEFPCSSSTSTGVLGGNIGYAGESNIFAVMMASSQIVQELGPRPPSRGADVS